MLVPLLVAAVACPSAPPRAEPRRDRPRYVVDIRVAPPFETVTGVPAATVRGTTSVVGSGRVTCNPVTASREPARSCVGPLGQSRKTSRRTVRFGVKVTDSLPVTVSNGGAIRTSTT
jgi:hypothetical protein